MKNQSSKLWEVSSSACEDKFWVRAKTKPEAKKILKEFLKSPSYWQNYEIDYEFAMKLYKVYTDYIEVPGVWLDDTRGDVILDLTNPGNDFILNDEKKIG